MIVDALPFIDTLIDDNEQRRQMAMQMVDDELEVYPPAEDYLAHLPDIPSLRPFNSELIQLEHAILEEGSEHPTRWTASELASLKVDIPPPQTDTTAMTDQELNLWQRCFNQVKIKLEYRQRQLINLDLMKTYSGPAWDLFIKENERVEAMMKQELKELDDAIQEINRARKSDQEHVQRNLDILQANWDNLSVSNQMLLEEVVKLRARYEPQTKSDKETLES